MNRVHLLGNIGGDIDARQTKSGSTVANFSLATNRRTKRGDDWVDVTDWHRVVAFGKQAEIINEYLGKGRQVAIEGLLTYNEWEDQDGKKRKTAEVIVDKVHFVRDKGQTSQVVKGGGDYSPRTPGDDELPF